MSGQRSVSPVAGVAKPLVSKRVAVAAIGAAAAAVLVWAWWRSENPAPMPDKEKLPTTLAATVPYTPPVMVIPRQAATPAAFMPTAPSPQRYYEPPRPPPPAPAPSAPSLSRMMPAVMAPRPKANMISFADPPPAGPRAGDQPRHSDEPPVSGVDYETSHVNGIRAGLLGDQTFLLMPGILPCTMDTAINSTFDGPIQCHVARDIRPHGVTLLSRGAIIQGWYHNQIQSGQDRLFVQADWVRDTSGCFIKFDNAPISDTLGRAGIPGSVDQHYLERFGAAMVLTLGQSGESLGQAMLSKGGNTYLSFNGGGGGMDQLANAILRKQIDIPPTITVNQGSDIAVFTTRILDFSPCYDIKVKDR